MNIAITGYCGTGSSAVLDLLTEYSSCSVGKLDNYEHIPLYTPNGLFDLEYKLLEMNNLHRSDEAIKSFYSEMRRLNDNNFGWFGGYQKHFGNYFMQNVDSLIRSLISLEFEGIWSYSALKMRPSLFQFGKDCVRTLLGKKTYRNFGEKQVNRSEKGIVYAFVNEDEFYEAAKQFIRNYFIMTKSSRLNTIYDHLILPHNLCKIDKYFDDDFRVVVVDRDVRDLFVLGKYVWPTLGASAPFPKDVVEFADFWKRMRSCEKASDDKRILRIFFEDLIYNYDSTVNLIEEFIDLDPEEHLQPKKFFVPEKSIKNTQNFAIKEEWKKEVKYLETILPEYIYDFPYEVETSLKETFE